MSTEYFTESEPLEHLAGGHLEIAVANLPPHVLDHVRVLARREVVEVRRADRGILSAAKDSARRPGPIPEQAVGAAAIVTRLVHVGSVVAFITACCVTIGG